MSCTNHQTGFIRTSDIILIIFCSMMSWVGSIPFVGWFWIRLILAAAGGILLSQAAQKWLESRRQVFVREQFKWLLEHLVTRLTSGVTLESAFLDAASSLSKILGKKSLLLLGLALLERQLTACQPLTLILPQFSRFLPCPEAQRFFQILPELRQSGGQVSQFVRQQLGMTLEQLALQQDLSAETTQRQTEALILTVMPFILAFLLRDASESISGGLFSSPFGTVGMLLSYGIAMAAAILTFSSLGLHTSVNKNPVAIQLVHDKRRILSVMIKPGLLLHQFYQNRLPDSYGVRLLKILQTIKNQADSRSVSPCHRFFQIKAALILIALVPTGLFVQACPNLWYILALLPLVISLAQDQQIFQIARQRQIECQLEYPLFLNLIAALLQSGVSVHMALDICLRSYLANPAAKQVSTNKQAFLQDLGEIRKHLQIGMPASQIIEKFAAACPVAEAQAALLLIARYDRSGGEETLQVLQIQAAACQSLYRNTVRRQLELRSLRLLLPMTLDLMSVILTTILPAVQSLMAI